MAVNTNTRDRRSNVVPLRPPKSGFGRRTPARDSPMESTNSTEAMVALREMAAGWTPAVQKALRLPDTLFRHRRETLLFYSTEENEDALQVANALDFGQPLPTTLPLYAILLTEKTSGTDFLLIDMNRNIIVREMLTSYHSDAKDEWGKIVNAIESAVRVVQQTGRLAVYDRGYPSPRPSA
ncbi:MAG TPA: hypothetical protein VJH24_00255 [Candidatus Bilamarchaeaceae archaeon]|nr:hypothetical protein [Candidatus Bilamarchaeaceae archaeon]